jgi:hypothetical protein
MIVPTTKVLWTFWVLTTTSGGWFVPAGGVTPEFYSQLNEQQCYFTARRATMTKPWGPTYKYLCLKGKITPEEYLSGPTQ